MDLEDKIIKYCSPTLVGIKPSNLFSMSLEDYRSHEEDLDCFIEDLSGEDIEARVFCRCDRRVLILIYRRRLLELYLSKKENQDFLKTMDYPPYFNLDAYLDFVIERMTKKHRFPHEIGIFLGIPLVDVKGFIENEGRDYKELGYWKVYGSSDSLELFDKFTKARIYLEAMKSKGYTIKELLKGGKHEKGDYLLEWNWQY